MKFKIVNKDGTEVDCWQRDKLRETLKMKQSWDAEAPTDFVIDEDGKSVYLVHHSDISYIHLEDHNLKLVWLHYFDEKMFSKLLEKGIIKKEAHNER